MFRFATVSLAAALSLFAAGSALAGESASKAFCAKGEGKVVCCKTFVADHCSTYVSCCEVGNAGFHSAKSCPKHGVHTASVQPAGSPAGHTHAAKTAGTASTCSAAASTCSAA